MATNKSFFVLLFLSISCIQVVSSDGTDGANTQDGEMFVMDLKEDGLTLANEEEFVSQYGRSFLPAAHDKFQPAAVHNIDEKTGTSVTANKIDEKLDDFIWSADYGLSRHKRQVQDSNDPVYSGQDNPCDTNPALCNGTGEQCVYASEVQQGYTCECQSTFEMQNGTCVAIPERKKLYLTVTLRLNFTSDYANLSSAAALQLQPQYEAAFSGEFTGLEGYKLLQVVEFRDASGNTQVVISMYFTTDTTTAMTLAVASRVLHIESVGEVSIGSQVYPVEGYIGVFADLADTQNATASDAVDWCTTNALSSCPASTKCIDGGIRLRYSCDCRTGFVDVQGECVNAKRIQYALYPYGSAANDNSLRRSDDGSQKVLIKTGFPVGNKKHKKLFIGVNGFISFSRGIRPLYFALQNNKYMLCPYFSDADIRQTGDVFYQLYENSSANSHVFDKAATEVKEFRNISQFAATKVLVVTWSSVPRYGSMYSTVETVTVQTVLVLNETSTSAIVFYKTGSINWVYRPHTPLIVGVSKGPGFQPIKEIVSNMPVGFSALDKWQGNTGRQGMSFYELGETENPEQVCDEWYKRNLRSRGWYQFMSWWMPQCPCTSDGLSRIWFRFRTFKRHICFMLSFFASFRFFGYSRECCFERTGRTLSLVQDIPYAGSLLTRSPFFSRRIYNRENRWMHKTCCLEASAGYCELYYEVRPRGGCISRPDFTFAIFLGDPHITTLDGKDYTFNGWGEYLMLGVQHNDTTFALQGRTDRTTTDNGTVINATVFTAFAASDGSVDVHVELDSSLQSMTIYMDGKDYTTRFKNNTEMMIQESKYTLERQNDTLVVTFSSGISISISVGIKLLNIKVSLPNRFHNQTTGLLGNFNGDPDDDFVLPNGTMLSSNATEREIFNSFGASWAINDTESLFKYTRKQSAATFRHPDFVPIFLDEASSQLRSEAETICGGTEKLACIYDYIATGSSNVAVATGQGKEAADQEEAVLKNTAPELTVANTTVTVSANTTVIVQLSGTDADGDDVTYVASDTAFGNYQLNSTTGEVSYTVVTPNQTDNLGFYAIDSRGVPSPVKTLAIMYCPDCNNHGTCDFTEPRPSLSSQTFIHATCECEPWYDGDDCELDFDGCSEDPCVTGQNCLDIPAEEHKSSNVSYNCTSCPTGYDAIDGKCSDIDECQLDFHDCMQTCNNTEGSYMCSCNDGYRLSADDRSCEDINECVDKTSGCQQICTNTDGGFNCSCEDGYSLQLTNNTCVQDQSTRATCQSVGCSQECKLNGSSPLCFCRSGYTVNITNNNLCDDEDECAKGVCSQKCQNMEGSFLCSCYAGSRLAADGINCVPCSFLFYGEDCNQTCDCNGHASECNPVTGCVCQPGWLGTNCDQDDNECDPPSGICGQGLQTCINTPGSYRCDCLPGYVRSSANSECTDLDECDEELALDTCSNLENCVNTAGSFYCECHQGYHRSDTNCTDNDECGNGFAQCQHNCINTLGSFNCDCNYGYRLLADRTNCEKIPGEEVCAAALNCSVGCTLDDNDQPYCFCDAGWRLAADLETCIDIDECKEPLANCSDTCTNFPGSFTCSCPSGKRLNNDERTCTTCEQGTYGNNCQERCECGAGMDKCDPESGCVCKTGWTGKNCEQDINECSKADVLAGCNSLKANCVNFDGGYQCECNKGFSRNSTSVCEDINECNSKPCSQACENSQGSYRCLCNTGFTLKNGTCIDDDECLLTSTNLCTQQCVNTNGRYRCACESGFTLENDGFTCTANTECSNSNVCANTSIGGCRLNGTDETCFCYAGYVLESNNCVLKEVDWCGKANCATNCANITTKPYFNCSCEDGFKLADDGRSCLGCIQGMWGPECANQCSCVEQYTQECLANNGTCVCLPGRNGTSCEEDINECADTDLHSCVDNSTCKDTNGSSICECSSGFFQHTNGSCQECDEGFFGDCSTRCTCRALNTLFCNKQNGTCTCKSGWHGDNCDLDVQECNSSSPVLHNCTEPHLQCVEKGGGFDCVCEAGYKPNGTNARQCINRDECFEKSDNCSQKCTDTTGGFNCSCQAGFYGDGYNCTECPDGMYGTNCAETCGACNATGVPCDKVTGACIDFCSSNPCPVNSRCNNTASNYTCTCDQGFVWLSNGTCQDFDECLSTNHECNQTCTNTDGSYICSCQSGYTVNGTQCNDIDECSTNEDNCDQQCSNTDGGYNCTCNGSFILAYDNHTCHRLQTVPFGVRISVTITDLTYILLNTNSTEYRNLKTEVKQMLFDRMRQHMPSLHEVNIIVMRQGSLDVDGEAVMNTGLEADPVASLVDTLVSVLPSEPFIISGQSGVLMLVSMNNMTVSDKCSAYEAVTACPANQYCSVNATTSLPTCLPIAEDKDYKLIIGLSVGIPLFFVVLGALFVLVYIIKTGKHKRADSSDDDRSQLSGILANKIATRGSFFGAWKSPYSPCSPSVGSDSSSEANYRQPGKTWKSRRSEPDTAAWSSAPRSLPGVSEGAGPQNFSWDMFYNLMSPETPKFTIKRPKVDLVGNQTYQFAIKRPTVTSGASPHYGNGPDSTYH